MSSLAPVLEPARVQPDVEIVVPVHNEAAGLERSILRLYAHLMSSARFTWQVTVVDNASTDGTSDVAYRLSRHLPGVRAFRLPAKGRGGALNAMWSRSGATVLAYMDVDLSTDLNALLPLVAPLLSGHSDVAIGTRLARGSRTLRGPKREVISRCYNLLLHATLATRFSDAQCGFKAIRADRARELLPLVEDTGWFFDTELLVLAERAGLRIHEVPVDWVDDPDSRVDIVAAARADLLGIARLLLRPPDVAPAGTPLPLATQVTRFALVGVLSTLAYLVMYVALRGTLSAQTANALALLATTVGNTAANRRFTFRVRGRGAVQQQLRGLITFGVALAVTAGSLALLHRVDPSPSRLTELVALVVANLMATVLRFTLLRHWVFRRHRVVGRLRSRPPEPVPTPSSVLPLTTTTGSPR
jgi:putative flippase GtrA